MPNLYLVYTDPMSDAQEAVYNDWYSNTHLGEVVAIPGIVSATRYKVASASASGAPHRYLAIYELEDGVTPEDVQANLGTAVQGGRIQMTDALRQDTDPTAQSFWEQISDRVTAS